MFINIRKIVKHLRSDVVTKLPQIHAATARDTTSFLHVVGKLKFLKSVSIKKNSSGF